MDEKKSFSEKVSQDSENIAGFFGTRRGFWTVVGLAAAIAVCSIMGWVWSW